MAAVSNRFRSVKDRRLHPSVCDARTDRSSRAVNEASLLPFVAVFPTPVFPRTICGALDQANVFPSPAGRGSLIMAIPLLLARLLGGPTNRNCQATKKGFKNRNFPATKKGVQENAQWKKGFKNRNFLATKKGVHEQEFSGNEKRVSRTEISRQ